MPSLNEKWLIWPYSSNFKETLVLYLRSPAFVYSKWTNFKVLTALKSSGNSSTTSLQLSFVVTAGLLILCIFRTKTSKKFGHAEKFPSLAIQVLSAIFTPVSVAWPLQFASCFEAASFKEPQNIKFDIIEVLRRICLGQIEMRDPDDLLYLFQGKLLVYGVTVNASMKTRWRIKTTIWTSEQILLNLFPSGRCEEKALLFLSTAVSTSQKALVDLDCISAPNLKSAILRMQLTLRPGTSITVEFSCLTIGVGFLTTDFMHCTIPFLPYLSGEKRGQKKNRKATPLFTSIQEIVSLFSTGHVMIASARNISVSHAASLRSMERDLVNNREIRTTHISEVGLEGWREDRLMLAWEAGLLCSGLLVRWRMIITK